MSSEEYDRLARAMAFSREMAAYRESVVQGTIDEILADLASLKKERLKLEGIEYLD